MAPTPQQRPHQPHGPARAIGVALVTVTLAATAGCGGHDKPAAQKATAATPPPAANTLLPADAPKWCEHLVTDTIQKMAAALPDVAAGDGTSTPSGAAVVAGAEQLRVAAADVPADVRPALLDTAESLSSFVNTPTDHAKFQAATKSLKQLATQAHQECGL